MKQCPSTISIICFFMSGSLFAETNIDKAMPLKTAQVGTAFQNTSAKGQENFSPKEINFSREFCQFLIKQYGPEEACTQFNQYVSAEIDSMDNKVETISLLFSSLQLSLEKIKFSNSTKLLSKDIELMHSYYKDCYDELEKVSPDRESIYLRCITHFKNFQNAIQNFRNSTANILQEIKLMIEGLDSSPADLAMLKNIKKELKIIIDSCNSLIKSSDRTISNLVNILQVFHEKYTEERNKGLKTKHSTFGI